MFALPTYSELPSGVMFQMETSGSPAQEARGPLSRRRLFRRLAMPQLWEAFLASPSFREAFRLETGHRWCLVQVDFMKVSLMWMDEILFGTKPWFLMIPRTPSNNGFWWFQSGAGFRSGTGMCLLESVCLR